MARWKERLDDPLNRFYRYPVARLLVRVLVRTSITPNQVTCVQPLLAGVAGYLITFDDRRHLVLAAVLFELRSILDCADGTLARAKRMVSAAGHAIDGLSDWLATALLYAGIFWHFRLHAPPAGAWSRWLSMEGVLFLALLQGALRSFAADYYKLKYTSIFEEGRDETEASLRRKASALGPGASIFARVDLLVGRAGHLIFERRRFDPASEPPAIEPLQRRERSPLGRAVAALWSVSNGDAFLSMVTASIVVGRLWEAQVFLATVGTAWIVAVIALNGAFTHGGRGASRAHA